MSEIKKIQWNEVKRLMRCHRKKEILVQFKNWISGEKSIGEKKKIGICEWWDDFMWSIYTYLEFPKEKREKRERKKYIYSEKKIMIKVLSDREHSLILNVPKLSISKRDYKSKMIEEFSDKKKQKEFISTKLVLQNMLK